LISGFFFTPQSANTSLNSKVVSQNSSSELSPIAVDAVLKVLANPATDKNVNLKDIKIIKKLGGTVEVGQFFNIVQS
jgi:T-complex protein 1 subunit delta